MSAIRPSETSATNRRVEFVPISTAATRVTSLDCNARPPPRDGSCDNRETKGVSMNGFVYVQTNDAERNEVVIFGRNADGTLERLSGYLTGGNGSGSPHLPSQSSVVVDGDRLFVTNAGSDDVTLFGIEG